MHKGCILFGSYIGSKKEPRDLDVLFILDRDNHKGYKKRLTAIADIVPAKIHDIIQTEEDLRKNITRKDRVILEILTAGIILWGQKTIIKVIKDVYQGKTE